MALSSEAKRAIAAAMRSIEKKYGDEVFLDTKKPKAYETISTGSAIIDDAIGIIGKSGLPKGRIIEIYGPESSGKTSISMSAVAAAQRENPDQMVLYVDAEQAFNLVYAQKFGIDVSPDKFMITQPDSAEQALQVIREMAATGAFSLVVLDSVASMATESQLAKAADEKTMGALAGVMSPELTKIKTVLNKTGTIGIFINQTREKVSSYGGGETTPGGKALPFYASLRIRVSKIDQIVDPTTKDVIGQELKIDFKKNKVGTPYKVVTTKLIFGKGFDFESEYVQIAEKKGIIHKGGAWYSWTDSTGTLVKFQGEVRASNHLKQNPAELDHLKALIQQSTVQIETDVLPPEEQVEDEDGSEVEE